MIQPLVAIVLLAVSLTAGCAQGRAPAALDDATRGPMVIVSNERSGDVSVIDATSLKVLARIPVGKRPRGVAVTVDGATAYVALSGSPIQGPPQLDAQGNPILNEENEEEADHSADGIGEIDLRTLTFVRKLPSGSDPEAFALSVDGATLYISNEDVATMSVLDVASQEIRQIVPVKPEPEGVSISPDGRHVWVTCETNGEVVVVDGTTHEVLGEVPAGGRPRTVAFSPDGRLAYIPSETTGQMHEVDAATFKILRTLKLREGARPMGTAVSPDGSRLYASTGRGGTVLAIDTQRLEVVGEVKVGPRPWGIALTPDGGRLFVANGPSNDVSVVDTARMEEIARIPAGTGPWGVGVASRVSE